MSDLCPPDAQRCRTTRAEPPLPARRVPFSALEPRPALPRLQLRHLRTLPRTDPLWRPDGCPYPSLECAALAAGAISGVTGVTGVTEQRAIRVKGGGAPRAVARAPRPGSLLARWALGCAAASLLAAGCTPERSRGAASSARVEPARPASASKDSSARPSASSTSGPGRSAPGRAAPRARPPRSDSITTSTTALAPGVNDEFDADILLDIDEALAATDENAFATLVKKTRIWVDGELVSKEKKAHPDSCRRWRSLRRLGYAPKNALAQQVNAGALVRCGSLEFLARAQPSQVSHVRRLLVGAGPSSLPAVVASATSPMALQARDRAVAKNSNLAELLPTAHVIPSELPGRLSIAEPTTVSSIILNAEVWGDVNADGIEDVVLSVLNTTDDGAYFDMRLVQVTRLSPQTPPRVLAVME